MTTTTNRSGEIQNIWTSHKHPDNPNFMQVVRYLHIQYTDGRNHLYWSLVNASANDKHMIANISLEDAQNKYTDPEVVAITEADFEKWLADNK